MTLVTTLVGALGAVVGVTGADRDEVAPLPALLPTALVATTVKVYAVPLVRPLTTQGLVAHMAVAPPGDAVTV